MSNAVTVAVFPVAGRGTRFLPATKASPKEMLPVVDKPLIQYAVEEALEAGARTLVFITGRSKRAIEDHFDQDHELERELEQAGKEALLECVRQIVPASADCLYIRQSAPLGLGHAVLCARPVVGDRPFFVHLADDLISASPSCLSQMQEVFLRVQSSVLAVQTVPEDQTDKYGIAAVEDFENGLGSISSIVEKPSPETAPSTLGVVGRYILTPDVFNFLESIGKGAGGEIQLTDGIGQLLQNQKVYAYRFDGVRYDCGDKLGYLRATVELALAHPDLGDRFRHYLTQLDA
ncbi:MAG: UTP--glucose-1-phosphate uridylyltransferase GalU [Gammaproteobacteria bacterium]